ncbi:MAG TPA: DoxX family protein [Pirellulales bacterium]|nr:DoxX family protein [Pirellulales bacterium]
MTGFFSNFLSDARLAPFGAFVLRLGLAAAFIAHALHKLLAFTLPGTAEFFAQHGFPGWSAYPVFALELLGGMALALGVFTRPTALALIPVLGGALLVHAKNGWFFASPGGGWEYIAFLMLALGAQTLLGPGAWALPINGRARVRRASAPARLVRDAAT